LWDSIVNICRNNPQILIFLALAIGYAVGKLKYRGFGLGATTCTLLAALALGQINVEIPPLLKTVSFALFMFGVGYKVGPAFFGALRKEGLHYIYISLIISFVGLGTAILLGKLLNFDQGTTAGLLAGSMTQSATIGTAEGAIGQLPIADAQKTLLDTNVAVGYAITYIFGTAGTILFLKGVPLFWRINFKDEAKKLEEKMSGGAGVVEKPELFSWCKQLELRAYKVSNQKLIGKKVSDVETVFPGRVAVNRLKRGNTVMHPEPTTVIESGDIIVISGGYNQFTRATELIGNEMDMAETNGMMGEVMEICVLKRDVAGKTLGELSKLKGAHGVFLRRITRQGHEIPITRDTVVHKCDVLQVIGAKEDVESVIKLVGYPERPTAVTDLVMVGLGIVLGTLLGLVVVHVGKLPITFGVGGGVLVAGLVFGWLRSVHPTFGQIPSGGQWIFTDLGLNLFIACVGLSVAVEAIQAFETTGLSVFLAGIAVSLVPMIVALLFGRWIIKMNLVLLLGAVAGGRVITAALNSLEEDANSTMPAIGYAVPYAFSNVLLTIWGSVIINIM